MSNHFAKPEWHIENISSATGTHDLHAAGVGRAMVYYGHKGVAITSHGESATSEGFVYEAINGASNERLPVIFVFQDNGFGIHRVKYILSIAMNDAEVLKTGEVIGHFTICSLILFRDGNAITVVLKYKNNRRN